MSGTYRIHQRTVATKPLRIEPLEDRCVLSNGPLIISELMASNASTLADEDSEYHDWIEIHNPSDSPISLADWSLTDRSTDPKRWQFPEVALGADQYLVVFASGKNRIRPDEPLHTNFRLSRDGEYLALLAPDQSVSHEYAPAFPALADDQSYGVTADGAEAFFATPTPGMANRDTHQFAAAAQFSVVSGFFQDAFSLTLASESPHATILYSLDGSDPGNGHGLVYGEPLAISGSTVVRAIATAPGFEPSDITTASYLFLADVLQQTNARAIQAGWPETWGDRSANYGMSSRIVGPNDRYDGKYVAAVGDALQQVTSLSLVVDPDAFLGQQGIYSHPFQAELEAAVAGELIDPHTGSLVSFGAGMRLQGGISRFIASKNSLRLKFQSQYGESQLEYPLFGSGGDRFDGIVLRSSGGEIFAPGGLHYIRDAFARRLQLSTGQPSPRSQFVHLYINGWYWGIYEATERPDAQFAANYADGDKDEYDVLNGGGLADESDTVINGNATAWNQLRQLTDQMRQTNQVARRHELYMQILGQHSDGTDNPNYERLLDVDNYIDYLLVQWYVQNTDWPHRNYYMARRRGPESVGFQFYVWDSEFIMSIDNHWDGDLTQFGQLERIGPASLFPGLYASEAFRVRFADRAARMFAPNGPLYTNSDSPNFDPARPDDNLPAKIWHTLIQETQDLIVPESARWSDVSNLPLPVDNILTRDEVWLPRVNQAYTHFFPNRTQTLEQELQMADLYRTPPVLDLLGDIASSQTRLTLQTNPDALIYYTLDGSDPMLPDGSVAHVAIEYAGSFRLARTSQLTARSLRDGKWSAALDRPILVSDAADAGSLRISEIHFHPSAPTPAEQAAGFTDADDFEFIEIANVSNETISLHNVRLVERTMLGQTTGVDFRFANSPIRQLAPGQFVVIVENQSAFRLRYGDQVLVAGEWSGRLNNQSETVTLTFAPDGAEPMTIQQIQYVDTWFPAADGQGSSLELLNLSSTNLADWNHVDQWAASSVVHGTPGRPRRLVGDSNNDGVFDSADLVLVFAAGEYEDSLLQNSTWEEGDWNEDGEFDTADIVLAFQQSHYRFD